jgi:hypothetical protein
LWLARVESTGWTSGPGKVLKISGPTNGDEFSDTMGKVQFAVHGHTTTRWFGISNWHWVYHTPVTVWTKGQLVAVGNPTTYWHWIMGLALIPALIVWGLAWRSLEVVEGDFEVYDFSYGRRANRIRNARWAHHDVGLSCPESVDAVLAQLDLISGRRITARRIRAACRLMYTPPVGHRLLQKRHSVRVRELRELLALRDGDRYQALSLAVGILKYRGLFRRNRIQRCPEYSFDIPLQAGPVAGDGDM